MTRRNLLKLALAIPALGELIANPQICEAQDGEQRVEAGVRALMQKHQLPGLGLAISRHGKTIYSKGYGLADKEENIPFTPQTLCRIGSVSKAITNALVCVLLDKGKLKETDIALELISPALLTKAVKTDPRYAQITVAHCLTMTSGLSCKLTDAMCAGVDASKELGKPFPVRGLDYLQWLITKPLTSNPGEKSEYGGLHFTFLSQVVEAVTGKSYEANIRELLMEPIGAHTFRIAEGRRKDRLPGECTYYAGFKGRSIWPDDHGLEDEYPYTLDVANAEGAGALLCNAVDLARFMDAYGNCHILNGDSMNYFFAKRPPSGSGLAGWAVGYGGNNEVQVFNGVGAVLSGASGFAEWKGGYGIGMVTNHFPKDGITWLDAENVICRELGM